MADNNRYDYNLRVNTVDYQRDLQKAVAATQKSVNKMNKAYTNAQGPLAQLAARRQQATSSVVTSSKQMGRAMGQVAFESKKLSTAANQGAMATKNQSNGMRINAQTAANLSNSLRSVSANVNKTGTGMKITARNTADLSSSMQKLGVNVKTALAAQNSNITKSTTLVKLLGNQWTKTKKKQLAAMNATKDYEKTMHVFMKSVSRITTGIIISQAFYRITNAIQETIRSGWEFIGVMQKAQISFSTLMGTSVAGAEEFINVLEVMAAKTPFQLDPLRQFNQKLIAMGVNAQSMVPIMEGVTNAVAAIGGGNEEIVQIGNIFGRIVGKGKVSGRDLNSLARAGIPIYEIFRNELGLTSDQLQQVADQNISATEAINAMMRGFERFDGLADKLAKQTVPGLTSTIKDNVLFTTKNVLKKKHERYQAFLVTVLERMQELRMVSEKFGAKGVLLNLFGEERTQQILLFVKLIKNTLEVVRQLGSVIFTVLQPALAGFLFVLYSIVSILRVLSTILNRVTQRLFGLIIVKEVTSSMLALLGAILAINAAMAVTVRFSILAGKLFGFLAGKIAAAGTAFTAVTGVAAGWVIALAAIILGILKLTGVLDKFIAKAKSAVSTLVGLDGVSGSVSDALAQNNRLLDKYSKELQIGAGYTEELSDAMNGLSNSTQKSASALASFDEAYTLGGSGLGDAIEGLKDFRLPDFEVPKDIFDFSGTEEQFDNMLLMKEKLLHPEDFVVTPKLEEKSFLLEKLWIGFKGIEWGNTKIFGMSFSELWEAIKKGWLAINFGGWNPFEADFGQIWQNIKTAWGNIEWSKIKLFGISFQNIQDAIKLAWEITSGWETPEDFMASFEALWKQVKTAWKLVTDPESVSEESRKDFGKLWSYLQKAWQISQSNNETLMFSLIDSAFETIFDKIITSWNNYSGEGRDLPGIDPGSGFMGGDVKESAEVARKGVKGSTLTGQIQLQQEKIDEAVEKNEKGTISTRYMYQVISDAEKKIRELREQMRLQSGMQAANGGFLSAGTAQTGMFTREAYYKNTTVGENDQEEIVMPMTLDRGDPFIKAIIQGVIEGITAIQDGGNVTFIAADEASLRKLERKLEIIRLSEQARKGEVE